MKLNEDDSIMTTEYVDLKQSDEEKNYQKKRKGSAVSDAGKKKVILVTYPDEFKINEASGLVEAAGYALVSLVTQKNLKQPEYGVGSGKAEEMKRIAQDESTNMIIVDERLSSGQAHNLAKFTKQSVIDRERLILDIFLSRASTNEARLQVRLAELKYEIPRAREAVRLSLKGEQAGFMGMGEYAVDIRFRALKRQMSDVQRKLRQATNQRNLHRESRRRLSVPFVSLAGYTSSGKTTLFNHLVSESKEESSKLFTTLTTTTRSFELLNGNKVLISDTVGFISRLPTYMVEAFKSTLEELGYADLILLMLDANESEEIMKIKYSSCLQTLEQLDIDPNRIMVVFNKLDLISRDAMETKRDLIEGFPTVAISAKTGESLKRLKVAMFEHLFPRIMPVKGAKPGNTSPQENVIETAQLAESVIPVTYLPDE